MKNMEIDRGNFERNNGRRDCFCILRSYTLLNRTYYLLILLNDSFKCA